MTPYNCWFFGTKLPQPVFTILHAESNGEARRLAMHILRDSPGIEKVEVWAHGQFAFRVNQRQVHLELKYAGTA
jgi:hypothetical protein